MAWDNNDGLHVKFGAEEATVNNGGAFANPSNGGLTVVEVELDLTTLAATTAIISEIVLPKYGWIEKVELIPTETVTSSGSGAVLNVGLIRTDRTTTYDEDGLIDAEAQADFNTVGEIVTYTNTGAGDAGDLIGTQLANNGYLTADYDTEAFTDGTVRIRVHYRMNANRS